MISGLIATREVLALRSRAMLAGLDLDLEKTTRDGKFTLFHVISAEPERVREALNSLRTVRYGKARKAPKEVRNTIVGRKPQAHGQHAKN